MNVFSLLCCFTHLLCLVCLPIFTFSHWILKPPFSPPTSLSHSSKPCSSFLPSSFLLSCLLLSSVCACGCVCTSNVFLQACACWICVHVVVWTILAWCVFVHVAVLCAHAFISDKRMWVCVFSGGSKYCTWECICVFSMNNIYACQRVLGLESSAVFFLRLSCCLTSSLFLVFFSVSRFLSSLLLALSLSLFSHSLCDS